MNNIRNFILYTGVFLLFLPVSACTASDQNRILKTKDGAEIKIENVVSGLNHPWGMAILKDNRILITERNTGNLYIIDKNGKLSEPIKGVPEVYAKGQGGLMDVALDPEFEKNSLIYLSYAKPGKGGKAATALGGGRLKDNRVEEFRDIFVQEPYISGSKHFGNRILFSEDGKYLFLCLGERFQFDPAQDISNHLGAIIRIYPDGRIPDDNPFVGQENAKHEIWSYGHRNIEAMAIQPETGELWVGEMGPKGGDELNRIEKGANYGWPVVSWGEHYFGRDIPDPPTHPEFKDAEKHWTPVISPSGMIFYNGKMLPAWKNNALIGGLTTGEIVRLSFEGLKVKEEERLSMPARVRDVEADSDGVIYILTDEDDGGLFRISVQ